MGIWRDPMFEKFVTTRGIGERVAGILESCGLRCTQCGSWCDSTISITRRIVWGTNAGGLLLMDPLFLKAKIRTCRCGHTMFARIVCSESV